MNRFILTSLLLLFCIPFQAFSQTEKLREVVIGIKQAPPFVEKADAGYRGLSIDSWNLVNRELGWKYVYKEYPTLEALLSAIEKEEVDFSINPITVTADRYEKFLFSQPYFISNTVMAKKAESPVWNVLVNLWSWKFISAVAVLAFIIFVFGFLVWIFERKKNKEQFGVGKWHGLGQGFWWSAVTMTTVGYGDKAPVTTMGRLVGLVWMFFAVITISSLTAGIASALTVQNLKGDITSIDELMKYDVETLDPSSSSELLRSNRIDFKAVSTVQEGIKNLKKGKSQVFVYDGPLIRYEINQADLRKDIVILPTVLRKDYLSYCFPKESELLKVVNPSLVNTLKSLEWNTYVKKFEP